MRLRRTTMIAALSQLAWAATASAECAWVMWAEKQPQPEMAMEAHSAYETKQACERALHELLDSMRASKNVTVLREATTAVIQERKKDGSMVRTAIRYVCLPDTVAPRGPKGK